MKLYNIAREIFGNDSGLTASFDAVAVPGV